MPLFWCMGLFYLFLALLVAWFFRGCDELPTDPVQGSIKMRHNPRLKWPGRLAVQDAALSRRRSRVRFPSGLPLAPFLIDHKWSSVQSLFGRVQHPVDVWHLLRHSLT